MVYTDGQKTINSKLKWYVLAGTFRLDYFSKTDSRSYVFNGRTLYGCAKMDQENLKLLSSLKLTDTKILAALKRGSCQQVSPDFMLAFTLSPEAAISSNRLAPAQALSISVLSQNAAITGKTEKVHEVDCVGMTREYKLSSTLLRETINYQDEICHSPLIKWRQKLFRELSRFMNKEANGKRDYGYLKRDLANLSGMTLFADTIILRTKKDASKQEKSKGFTGTSGLITIQTTTIIKENPKKRELVYPRGFSLLEENALEDLAKIKITIEDSLETPVRRESNLLDLLQLMMTSANLDREWLLFLKPRTKTHHEPRKKDKVQRSKTNKQGKNGEPHLRGLKER